MHTRMADPDLTFIREQLRRAEEQNATHAAPLAPDDDGPHAPQMSDERVAKLEGAYDALKVVRPMTITVLSVLLAALVFVLSSMFWEMTALSGNIAGLNTKIENL